MPRLHIEQQQQTTARRPQSQQHAGHGFDSDPSAFFFPILPYSFNSSVAHGADLTGWVLPSPALPAAGTASATATPSVTTARVVFDHETGCDVVEIATELASSLKDAAASASRATASAALVNTASAVGRASALLLTERGGHAYIDAVRVTGATGAASAVDTTLSQRLRKPDFGTSTAKLSAPNLGEGVASPPLSPLKNSNSASASSSSKDVLEFPHASQFIGTSLPCFNLHLKSLGKFVRFSVQVEDTAGKLYTFDVSNSSTIVRLRLDGASLPLTLRPGWNKLCLDLAHLTRMCFNAEYAQAHRVRIHASCRVRRAFFSDTEYPDFALPECLRVFPDGVHQAKRQEDDERAMQQMQQGRTR